MPDMVRSTRHSERSEESSPFQQMRGAAPAGAARRAERDIASTRIWQGMAATARIRGTL